MKGMACGKFRRHAQNWQKACDQENRILRPLLGQFFFEPGKAENVSWVLVLVVGLFTFQVPDISIDVNNRNMVRNKVEISTCKHSSNGALYVCSSRYCFSFAPLIFSILGISLFFGDSWTFFFLFFDIFLHLGAQKK